MSKGQSPAISSLSRSIASSPPIEDVLTSLLNDLLQLPTETVLGLDDYHLIEDQTIHDALMYLVEHMPPNMHLVIASRSDPLLPLARLRARGALTELRADNLRFTSEETTAFLTEVMGLPLSAEEVAVLEARTEGWIAGLHLAALSNDPLGDLNKQITYDINQHASMRLARAAKEAGVRRFLFSSSCSLYGAGADGHLDESAAFNPVTAYGESKILVEQELDRLADESFSPVYLRNATAYGASRRLRADIVVNNLTAAAVTTGKVRLESDGTPWRPLVHIEDISRAFLAMLEAPREKVHDETFNVGQAEDNVQVRDIAEMVRDAVPGSELTLAASAGRGARAGPR